MRKNLINSSSVSKFGHDLKSPLPLGNVARLSVVMYVLDLIIGLTPYEYIHSVYRQFVELLL